MDDIVTDIVYPWYKINGSKEMMELTWEQQEEFTNQTHCYLCKKIINIPVRDHDHFTGQYLGAACQDCNLARRINPSLPVVFHNLRGYDIHHILKYAIGKFPDWNLNVIPQSTEKFLTLTATSKGRRIRFIDSLQFLNSSLANLSKNLPCLPLTSDVFESQMMTCKTIFPYDMATSMDVLQSITELPPIWEGVSQEDYIHANRIWQQYNCETLLDYMLVYLKLDVFLLADVFEAFREKTFDEDGLEALSFVSIPGLSWASAIKQLPEPVELIQDPELYRLFEAGIRGGMTFINKHHVEADESTQMSYLDVNNLYGWALSQKLPVGEFRWINDQTEMNGIVERCANGDEFDGDRGYVLEVDIVIPDSIQDKLDDLPIAPELCYPPGSKVEKLLLTHEPKKNYVVNGRVLTEWLSYGAKVTKVNRAVEFKQVAIFKGYIDYNTKMRAASTDSFQRDYYKLKNNSLYGKTVENLKKRINLRLCSKSKRLITYCSNPMFRRSIKIADDLIVLYLIRKLCV